VRKPPPTTAARSSGGSTRADHRQLGTRPPYDDEHRDVREILGDRNDVLAVLAPLGTPDARRADDVT
jgi:hypothetical protein